MNTATDLQQRQLTCPTQKKCHKNSAEAESFAFHLLEKHPQQPRQHAYACEECPNWHLSALPADAHALAKPTVINGGIGGTGNSGLAPSIQHLQTKIKDTYIRLRDKHGSQYRGIVTDVCKELDIATRNANGNASVELVSIYGFLQEAGVGYVATRAGVIRKPNHVLTVDDLENEEATLQRRLAEINAKKQALIAATRTRIDDMERDGEEVVVIRKEGNSIVLSHADAYELVDMLTTHMCQKEEKEEKAS